MPRKPTPNDARNKPDSARGKATADKSTNSPAKKPRGHRHISSEEIARAIYAANGLISVAAKALNCDRATIYGRRDDPIIAEAINTARAHIVLDAEDALRGRIKEGDTTAIIFALKTLGRALGYVERQEMTGANGTPLTIRLVDETEGDNA